MTRTYILLLIALTSLRAQAQEESKPDPDKQSTEIIWKGYLRSFFYYRNLPIKYDDTRSGENWYKLNGGYNEPLIRLTAEAHPSENSQIEIEYTFDHQMTGQLTGQGISGESGRISLPLQSLRFNGSQYTKVGRFNVQAGGIRFYNLTSLTFGGFSTRYDPFERVPWEGEDHPWTRYKKGFNKTANSQALNSRFGSAIFQGAIIEGSNLPGGIGFNALFGKSINSGGYQTWLRNNPKKSQAYRVYKKFPNLFAGVTLSNSFGRTSQTAKTNEISTVITSDLDYRLDKIAISTEFGLGSYSNPNLDLDYTPIFKADINATNIFAGIDMDIQLYHIGESVVNQNSGLVNTSVSSASNEFGDTSNLGNGYLPGAITDLNQLANNRQGGTIGISKNGKRMKASIGYGISQELNNRYNAITFQHRLNKATRSRFSIFQSGAGPYGRISSIYLTTFETLATTDSTDISKSFQTVDVNLKWKGMLFGKGLIMSAYMNYNTVNKGIGGDKYLTLLYTDLMARLKVRPDVIFVFMSGIESIQGTALTELAENSKPLDSFGTSFGWGIDTQLNDRASLYLRNRWFEHEDKNFVLDKFKGSEWSIELKIFF